MKKTYIIILLSIAIFILPSCESSSNSKLKIKGTVISAALKKASTRAPGTVTKVLIYRDFGDADISIVDDSGNFAINVDRNPCGLIFLDASDTVAGYLSLAEGIEALPLSLVGEDTTVVDLQSITITDGVASPQHNPIDSGGEMEMSETEKAAYKLQSSLFSAIIRNMDMNSDGVLDILSDRPYKMLFGADFSGGIPGTSDPGDSGPMPVLNCFHFNFGDNHPAIDTPDAILSAPDTTEFTCHEVDNRFENPVYHWVIQSGWDSFQSGSYTITYDIDDKQVGFDITSSLTAETYIVAAHLWYEMEGETMTRVHWKWKMLNGSSIDATKLMKNDVGLQFIFNDGTQTNYHVTPADTSCNVDINSESMAKLLQINVSCKDLFGNWQPTFYNMPTL